jgi:metallo-beta-lactamase class B
MNRRLPLIALLLAATLALAQNETPPSWTTPVEPVRIAGNLYYVGTEELGSYLLAGEDGLVLLDVPMDENAALVLNNIEKLGFAPKDVRYLLASHAHLDHIGGFAAVKAKTGAKVAMTAEDADLAARGGKGDFAFGDRLAYPPVETDRILGDGDVIRVGRIAMTAIHTPGHTRGCTTWRTTVEENGRPLDVVFLCSVTAPGYRLVGNAAYPEILDHYRATFAKLRRLDPDVFLANHAGFFDLEAKRTKKRPWVGRGELAAHLDRAWAQLEKQIAAQRPE